MANPDRDHHYQSLEKGRPRTSATALHTEFIEPGGAAEPPVHRGGGIQPKIDCPGRGSYDSPS